MDQKWFLRPLNTPLSLSPSLSLLLSRSLPVVLCLSFIPPFPHLPSRFPFSLCFRHYPSVSSPHPVLFSSVFAAILLPLPFPLCCLRRYSSYSVCLSPLSVCLSVRLWMCLFLTVSPPSLNIFLNVCVCVCACVRACVRAPARVCMWVHARASVCKSASALKWNQKCFWLLLIASLSYLQCKTTLLWNRPIRTCRLYLSTPPYPFSPPLLPHPSLELTKQQGP